MNIAMGSVLRIKEPVFAGSFRKPTLVGYREFVGEVIKDSYGSKKGQHTFTLRIIKSLGGIEPLKEGDIIRRKGRNLYKNTIQVLHDAPEEVVAEKVARGDAVRQRKRHCGRCGRAFLLPAWILKKEDVTLLDTECGEC